MMGWRSFSVYGQGIAAATCTRICGTVGVADPAVASYRLPGVRHLNQGRYNLVGPFDHAPVIQDVVS